MINFIHVNKCGGTTIGQCLEDNNIEFDRVHCQPAWYEPGGGYLIVIRNPIERFLSAFYWRYSELTSRQESPLSARFIMNLTELQFLLTHGNVDELLKNLYGDNGNLNLKLDSEINNDSPWGHPYPCGMGLNYYLGRFVKQCAPKEIKVVCMETLNEDIMKLFKIRVDYKLKENTLNKKSISDASRALLKNYLWKDYRVIGKLNRLGALSQKQFGILKK